MLAVALRRGADRRRRAGDRDRRGARPPVRRRRRSGVRDAGAPAPRRDLPLRALAPRRLARGGRGRDAGRARRDAPLASAVRRPLASADLDPRPRPQPLPSPEARRREALAAGPDPSRGRPQLSVRRRPARSTWRRSSRGASVQERRPVGDRRLGPEHRAAVLLREIEGLTYDEIATVLDVPIGTVRSRPAQRACGARRVRSVGSRIEEGDGAVKTIGCAAARAVAQPVDRRRAGRARTRRRSRAHVVALRRLPATPAPPAVGRSGARLPRERSRPLRRRVPAAAVAGLARRPSRLGRPCSSRRASPRRSSWPGGSSAPARPPAARAPARHARRVAHGRRVAPPPTAASARHGALPGRDSVCERRERCGRAVPDRLGA